MGLRIQDMLYGVIVSSNLIGKIELLEMSGNPVNGKGVNIPALAAAAYTSVMDHGRTLAPDVQAWLREHQEKLVLVIQAFGGSASKVVQDAYTLIQTVLNHISTKKGTLLST